MPAITQSQVQSLPDAMMIDKFVVNFGSVPGTGDTFNALTLRCAECVIPGFSNESQQLTLAGQTRTFRGQKKYSHAFGIQLSDMVDMAALSTLANWHENVVGTDSGLSQGYIDDYAVTANVVAYDTTGAAAWSVNIFRVYPTEVPDIQLNGQASQILQLGAVFAFDYWEAAAVPIL